MRPTLNLAIPLAAALLAAGCSSTSEPKTVAYRMSPVSGTNSQTTVVGTPVALAPAVLITTSSGDPAAGISVTFAPGGADGSVNLGSVVTNAQGIANCGGWTVGTTAGTNLLTASTAVAPNVTFTATGTPGAVTSLVISPSALLMVAGDLQQFSATGRDQYGNAIAAPPGLNFTTSDPSVATATADGSVQGVSFGHTSIIAHSGAVTGAAPLDVVTVAATTIGPRPFGLAVYAPTNIAYVGYPADSYIRRHDLPSTTIAASIPLAAGPADIAFLPDGSKAYVAEMAASQVEVVNVATNLVSATIPVIDNPTRVIASPDGATVYVATCCFIDAINTTTNVVTTLFPTVQDANGLALHPTLPLLYVSTTGGTLYEMDRTTNTVSRTFAMGGVPQDLAVSLDGSKIYVADENGPISVISTATFARVDTIGVHNIFGLSISRDGTKLYTARSNGGTTTPLEIIDLASHQLLLGIGGGVPRRIAFDKTGKIALITNEGGYLTTVTFP